jgi:hypothetical protein
MAMSMLKASTLALLCSAAALGIPTGANAATTLLPGDCVLNCLITPSTTSVPDPMLVRFNENGSATIAINGAAPITLTGTLGVDPSAPAGGGEPVLIYHLPLQVISGDVEITEPISTAVVLSDALRFTDATGIINGGATAAGSTIMIYYSDIEAGEPNLDLADTGFPANLGTGNFTTIAEVGTEGNNGFDYMPGGVAYPLNNEYVGISDAVPEPATWAMMLLGFAGLGFAGYRKAKKARAAALA